MKKIVVLFFTILLITSCTVEKETSIFPDADQIKSISIDFAYSKKQVKFNPGLEAWKNIKGRLLPAKKDANPAKWESLGDVNIELKDGSKFMIALFSTSSGKGAFAAGESWEKRVYYRGGSTSQLKKALNAAYEKTLKSE